MKPLKILIVILLLQNMYVCSTEAKKNVRNKQILMPEWKEVDDFLPRYSKFTVMDLETGLKFHVQRRAGSNHADVQPLTGKDTAIMKKIYNGKWSWKRRAIIVQSKGKKIAASMHGMPHGGGALKNNFPGHFCIHFYGSTTHRTNFMDLSHKLMILKAAGKLELYIEETNPYELVNAYVAGIKQQDSIIVSLISHQQLDWDTILPAIENINIKRMEILPYEDLTDELTLTVPVELNWQIKRTGSSSYSGLVRLVRFTPYEQWKVDSVRLFEENGIAAGK
ncbi:hypothetical protein [Bacillus sp. REN3]|uniref:hypothetical protein n=1 Tax=Bacillus sp. REN3 TaxID=2802440 RepID=UPI001AEDF81B|nr:hypothetical protein [Bacillus sp. REN3]